MQILSVNVGKAQPIEGAKASGKTGIFKEPFGEPVQVGELGLAGDEIVDTRNHGGPDQAVYVYGTEDYDWWAAELGREMTPGLFGENLTVSDLASADFSIGDCLHIGEGDDGVILQVTAPRIPCVTFSTRMGDPQFVKQFRNAERPGLYCRVLREGKVQAGDMVRVERYDGDTVTAIEMYREFYKPDKSEASLRRYLAAPIAIRDRTVKERRLRKVLDEAA